MAPTSPTHRDPLYGTFDLPSWCQRLMDCWCVRRLRFIKQLGLKAYISYPGANHTRYEHSMGTYKLAERVCKHLSSNTRDMDTAGIIDKYSKTVEMAAFLHDIGHGPFSHVIDNVTEGVFEVPHEKMSEQIIRSELDSNIQAESVSTDDIVQLINKDHKHTFLSDIVNSELDVDRMDYLPRDALHTGIEYKFGSDTLIHQLEVLRVPLVLESSIKRAKKTFDGLIRKTKSKELIEVLKLTMKKIPQLAYEDHVGLVGEEGVVLSETLLVIRKTMYSQVYYDENSRIAERMLNKAILQCLSDKVFTKDDFVNPKKLVMLDDYELFRRLQDAEGFGEKTVYRIKSGDLYGRVWSSDLKHVPRLEDAVINGENIFKTLMALEDELSKLLSVESEQVIIDYIPMESLEERRIFAKIDEKVRPLENVSSVAKSLVERIGPSYCAWTKVFLQGSTGTILYPPGGMEEVPLF